MLHFVFHFNRILLTQGHKFNKNIEDISNIHNTAHNKGFIISMLSSRLNMNQQGCY